MTDEELNRLWQLLKARIYESPLQNLFGLIEEADISHEGSAEKIRRVLGAMREPVTRASDTFAKQTLSTLSELLVEPLPDSFGTVLELNEEGEERRDERVSLDGIGDIRDVLEDLSELEKLTSGPGRILER